MRTSLIFEEYFLKFAFGEEQQNVSRTDIAKRLLSHFLIPIFHCRKILHSKADWLLEGYFVAKFGVIQPSTSPLKFRFKDLSDHIFDHKLSAGTWLDPGEDSTSGSFIEPNDYAIRVTD